MAKKFLNDVPETRFNIKPGLKTGSAMNVKLPLHLLSARDCSVHQTFINYIGLNLNQNNFTNAMTEPGAMEELTRMSLQERG